tara:strand:- start:72 stop:467 length:396 start_codon:yes stop_codon:yes gene_type:complete
MIGRIALFYKPFLLTYGVHSLGLLGVLSIGGKVQVFEDIAIHKAFRIGRHAPFDSRLPRVFNNELFLMFEKVLFHRWVQPPNFVILEIVDGFGPYLVTVSLKSFQVDVCYDDGPESPVPCLVCEKVLVVGG